MARSNIFLAMLAIAGLAGVAMFIDASWQVRRAAPRLAERAKLVEALGLTDLVLFTEARYTRHLSQADLHSAFQDHPFAFEHFPSGALVSPPHRKRNAP